MTRGRLKGAQLTLQQLRYTERTPHTLTAGSCTKDLPALFSGYMAPKEARPIGSERDAF